MYSSFIKNHVESVTREMQMLCDLKTTIADTYLSPRVHHILCSTHDSSAKIAECALTSDGHLDFNVTNSLLPTAGDEDFDYFVSCAKSLSPVFSEVHCYFLKITPEAFKAKYFSSLKWTSSPEILCRCFQYITNEDGVGVILSLLLSSAILERSLGDLYLLRGTQCPSMLKDLLVSNELKEILGGPLIKLLRVLIGPPVSLNLRNVTWHGFPAPGELDSKYAAFLLLLTASISAVLQKKGHLSGDGTITHRPFLSINKVPPSFKNILPMENESLINEIFVKSEFVPDNMIPILKLAVSKCAHKRYGECVALLLPQLELSMRKVFASVNHCSDRLLTAENTTLFTTFDEILSEYIESDKKNQLRYVIGDSAVTLLCDLLIYTEGPRIRDHISHGEMDFDNFPKDLAYHIMGVYTALACCFIPEGTAILENVNIQALMKICAEYKSLYHPVSIVKHQLEILADSLASWKSLPWPPASDIEMSFVWEELTVTDIMSHHGAFSDAFKPILTTLEPPFSRFLNPFNSTKYIHDLLLNFCAPTLHRYHNKGNPLEETDVWSGEEELIMLISSCLSEAVSVTKNISDNCSETYVKWKERKLRSRQRITYRRMLESIPVISVGFRFILYTTVILLLSLHKLHVIAEDAKLIRMYRTIHQYCGNLKTFTATDRNRWEEAVTATTQVVTKLHQLIVTLS